MGNSNVVIEIVIFSNLILIFSKFIFIAYDCEAVMHNVNDE